MKTQIVRFIKEKNRYKNKINKFIVHSLLSKESCLRSNKKSFIKHFIENPQGQDNNNWQQNEIINR